MHAFLFWHMFWIRFSSLQLKTNGKLLRDRYGALYRKIKASRHRGKLFAAIHHINILQGEFDAKFESLEFDEEFEPDPKVRVLSARVDQLQQSLSLNDGRHREELQKIQEKFDESQKLLQERDGEKVVLQEKNTELEQRNAFLSNHANALEMEVQENHQSLGLKCKEATVPSEQTRLKLED